MLEVDLGCNRKLELELLPMTRRVDYAGERSEVVKYFFGILSTKGWGKHLTNLLLPICQAICPYRKGGRGGGYPSYG